MTDDERAFAAYGALVESKRLDGHERSRAGNEALGVLYPVVRRVVRSTVRQATSEHDDIVQHVMRAILRDDDEGKSRAESSTAFLGWVRTVAMNQQFDHLRKQQKLGESTLASGEDIAERLPAKDASPSDCAESREELAALRALCTRVLARAGRRGRRITIFLRARVGALSAPRRDEPGGKAAATRFYQDRTVGQRYFVETANELELTDLERMIIQRLMNVTDASCSDESEEAKQ